MKKTLNSFYMFIAVANLPNTLNLRLSSKYFLFENFNL